MNAVLILAVNSSTQDLLRSIRSFKEAGVERIMMLDSSKYGMVPAMDSSVRMFHSEEALVSELGGIDGFVYVTKRLVAPKDFAKVVFRDGLDRKRAYGLCAMKSVGGASGNRMAAAWWSRRPNDARYAENDSGDYEADMFTETEFVLHSSALRDVILSSGGEAMEFPAKASLAVKSCGIGLVCMDTPWGRPVRLQTKNVWQKTLSRSEAECVSFRYEGPSSDRAPEAPGHEESNDLPALTVAFFTHDRTAVACRCLGALCENLSYSGRLRFCVCDDRSREGHVEALERVLREHGVSDYSVKRTGGGRAGLGASMNNGLRDAFSVSPVVLTAEDDFLLTRGFDATDYVRLLADSDVAGIRLAYLRTKPVASGVTFTESRVSRHPGMRLVVGGSVPGPGRKFVFNNQVMLRHRRAYDRIGSYREDLGAAECEMDMCARYVRAAEPYGYRTLSVLYPESLSTDTLDNGLFVHIGRSTSRHGYAVPEGYEELNSAEADERALSEPSVRQAPPAGGRPFFRIITPVRNRADAVERCARMLDGQTFRDFVWVVADDASTDGTPDRMRSLAETRPYMKCVFLKERRCAGGARNAALDESDSEYTLYLDSDDSFSSISTLQDVRNALSAKGFPDALALGYAYGRRIRRRNETSPKMLSMHNNHAPWTVCNKSSVRARFVEDRYRFNDVVWYYRLCDSVSTVSCMNGTAYRYSDRNGTSIHAVTTGNSNLLISSALHLMADLREEAFRHDYVKSAVSTVLSNVAKRPYVRYAMRG